MGVCRPRKRETGIHIGCRDKVAPSSVVIFFYGIEGHNVSRILRFQVFWLSQYLSAMCWYDSSEVRDFLRKETKSSHILDESANGGDRRDGEVARCAKACQDGVKFFLAKIRMNGTQATNFPKNKRIPFPGPFCFWGALLLRERVNLVSSQRKSSLPEEECSPLGFWKCFKGGAESVFFPKSENASSLNGLGSNHMSVS